MPFQSSFDFRCPARLVHGSGTIARIPEFLPDGVKVLIVTDKGLRKAGIVDLVASVLNDAAVEYAVFDGVLGNPPARCVHAGHRLYEREGCNAIVAVGGGSPMDVAKMIGVVATNGGRIDLYLGAGKVSEDLPPLLCVPTTYGTGSEVTPFAVLTNPRTHSKDPVISWKTVPQVGILDPDLSVALPISLGAPTGVDALTHAIESYVSLMASPISDGIAMTAIELIGENLRRACANDYELDATECMLIASALGGLAFSQTRLGNVHAMSHAVGGHFGTHHGLANAILLPYVMEFNLPARMEKFAAIADALGQETEGLSDHDAAWLAIEQVRQLNDDLGIPSKLGEVGVKANAIRSMTRGAMASGNIAVNPRKTEAEDIEALFSEAI